jgi:uncharacterized membrane protein
MLGWISDARRWVPQAGVLGWRAGISRYDPEPGFRTGVFLTVLDVDPCAAEPTAVVPLHLPATARAGTGAHARVRAIDWLRGLAVLVMIECHSLVLLQPRRVGSAFYNWLQGINGLVAPAFIFAAGFSLALVMARTSDNPTARRRRIGKSTRRAIQLILVADLLHLLTQPVLRHPILLTKIDILTCIACGLLIIVAICSIIPNQPWVHRAMLLALAVLVFAICPMTELYRGNTILTGFINESNDSVFPLIPWLGYLFLGGFLGSVLADPTTGKRAIWPVLIALLIAGWLLEYHLPAHWYPARADVWLLTNMGARIWRLAIAIGVLALLERLSPIVPGLTKNPLFALFELFSGWALPAYCIHLTLLYGALGNAWPRIYHGRLDWGAYAIYTAGIIAVTGGLSRLIIASWAGQPSLGGHRVRAGIPQPIG